MRSVTDNEYPKTNSKLMAGKKREKGKTEGMMKTFSENRIRINVTTYAWILSKSRSFPVATRRSISDKIQRNDNCDNCNRN